MNKAITNKLKKGLFFELDNLMVKPETIVMSPEFHNAIEKPSELRGVVHQL